MLYESSASSNHHLQLGRDFSNTHIDALQYINALGVKHLTEQLSLD
jgi:hypothetical protein